MILQNNDGYYVYNNSGTLLVGPTTEEQAVMADEQYMMRLQLGVGGDGDASKYNMPMTVEGKPKVKRPVSKYRRYS
jgi:hypothetical protein